ncbi:MAG TPA: TOBE domain-containing protein, partial [Xanthobacteraceae bacterium]|nr:TOBE domain-containing protein [Xanthobacteraceae bacterium]
ADRITVMRNGFVQQIGSPDAIYNRPVNRFVAGFLGSPQMNFIEGELADGAFVRGAFRLKLDPERTRGQDGRKVVLGLRSEDVEVGAARGGDLSGQAVLISPLGSEQHVNLQVSGVELVVRAPKEARIAVGDRIDIAIEPRRLHLFDASTDETLAGPS